MESSVSIKFYKDVALKKLNLEKSIFLNLNYYSSVLTSDSFSEGCKRLNRHNIKHPKQPNNLTTNQTNK
jgi:hypothetical protein